MSQPTHHQIATYLTDYVLSELVKYVMEDTGCSIEQAMERVYNSPLMPVLQTFGDFGNDFGGFRSSCPVLRGGKVAAKFISQTDKLF